MIAISLLYHGTIHTSAADILLHGVLLSKSEAHLDFGVGFYTTPNPDFAWKTADFRVKRSRFLHPNVSVSPRVLVFEFDEEMAKGLHFRHFTAPDLPWAQFVVANRCENSLIHATYDHNLDHKYDIVSGPTADGRGTIAPLIEQVNNGAISLDDLDYRAIAPAKNSTWGTQISFHTQAALGCIRLQNVLY